MGEAAARLGDPTKHGTPLGPGLGSSNVLIGGLPAWRTLVDVHLCPSVTGVVPHVGGVVAIGSQSVLINKMPAARKGDQVLEVGPPNEISAGEMSVEIG